MNIQMYYIMDIIFSLKWYWNCSKNLSYTIMLSKLICIYLQVVRESTSTMLEPTLAQEKYVVHILHTPELTPIELGLTPIVKVRRMICHLRTWVDFRRYSSQLLQKQIVKQLCTIVSSRLLQRSSQLYH